MSMLSHCDFEKLDKDDVTFIVEAIKDEIAPLTLSAEDTKGLYTPLPFYPDHVYLSLEDHGSHPMKNVHCVVNDQDMSQITVLDWTAQTLYDLNKSMPLKLSKNTVIEYVRFFYDAVRGPAAPFLIVEMYEDIPVQDTPSLSVKRSIGEHIKPLFVKEISGGFAVHGTMLHKDNLFEVELHVDKDGTITCAEQVLVYEDVPTTSVLQA